MSSPKYILTKEELELINERFGLDLQFNDAEHCRAAQVIWNLWHPEEESNDVTM